jgi:UDP-N-acetylmuramoyl-tripeptide--D-alanyl-D-alanine ligase
MTPLWSADAMAQAMRAERRGAVPQAITGTSIDTRTLKPGDAFFAIKGDSRDGHDFVDAAVKAGGVAVVAKEHAARFAGAPMFVVADVFEALRDLGRAARARSAAKIIGVTGSVGKTGTKEALRIALSTEGETHASVASYNNHWGVPLTLSRFPQSAKFGVFEIGMNHAGEITPLTKMVRPHVAIVTTVQPVHLEFFDSVEGIADAKAEIFLGLEPGGHALINRDNEHFERLKKAALAVGATVVPFGEHEDAEARAVKICAKAECTTVRATILGRELTYKIGAPGRHLVNNTLAVLAAASLCGADLAHAALALGDLRASAGRGERLKLQAPGGDITLIDESYNANPASMRAAFDLLGDTPVGLRGRRIAVLGDMLELGPTGPQLHAELAPALEAARIDQVFCAGKLMRSLFEALPSACRGGYAETAAEIESAVLGALGPGDAVMIKGSLGSKMGPIVKALQRKFPPVAPEDVPA